MRLCHDFADDNFDNDTETTVRDLPHRSTGAADLAEKEGAVKHLPLSVQEADTICMFESRLKTFLFDKAYS